MKKQANWQEKYNWSCRFHPSDWWHEIGCPHLSWNKEELKEAKKRKKAEAKVLDNYLKEGRER